ncbi:MAG: pyruvate dehydrogenase complex E1 component subunit beta [bacterium]
MAEMEFRRALGLAMEEEMNRDPDIFLMGEEVDEYDGAYKVSKGLSQKFEDKRVVDTPISEAGFSGLGIGAAMAGLRPIIEFMTWSFSPVAFDQLVNNAAKARYMSGGQVEVPITFRGPSGVVHQLAATHSHAPESWFAHVPGLKVVACSTPELGKGLLKSAIRDPDPVFFLESELMYGMEDEVTEDEDFTVPLHEAQVFKEGEDVTILAYSKRVHQATEAAEQLAEDGIDAEVIDLVSLRPLDEETILESVRKTNRLVTVEESWATAGIGASIVDLVQRKAFDFLDSEMLRITLEDVPMPYNERLENYAQPSTDKIVDAVRQSLYLDEE